MASIENFIPLNPITYSNQEMEARSYAYYKQMDARRSIREFSSQSFPISILENIIKTASTAPSGAHKQPWTFCIVSNAAFKKKIREAAEVEEYENYTRRMSDTWLQDLKAFGTDHIKPFIETAPYLIVVMKHSYEIGEDNEKLNNYYVNESVGIAVGFLISAIHNAGLFALTHTPSPMRFLKKILKRPENEQPYLLIPVGLPVDNVEVPDIKRKGLGEISECY
ncbi:MAG: iodotyrosine deiodinase [Salibacteraceae bacterium]|jgi:nitroreductase